MKTVNRYILILTILFFVMACSSKSHLFVDYSNPQIEYSGRIDTSQIKAAELFWSGTSIQINFKGKSIYALFEDENGQNYYNVIIDNNSPFILRPDTTKRYYKLASDLSKGNHKIEIFKRTEWDRGKTVFYGFEIVKKAKILPKPAAKKRRIEFYGNSITAGYAIEDFSGKDSPDSTFTNNYLSYSAITARHFDSEYRCICRSGIGIMISWFPLIMPEMYDRLIPVDATSKWDFSNFSPEIVVVNLFQNDSWLVNRPDNKEFKMRFGLEAPDEDYIIDAYIDFISKIRNEYPESNIICSLGNMDATKEGSKWTSYIEKAVSRMDDTKIYTHFMPYKETPGHPSIKEHEIMAKSLIKFIEDTIEW